MLMLRDLQTEHNRGALKYTTEYEEMASLLCFHGYQEEEKELVVSVAETKVPTEGCTGRNGEQEKSSGQKKISDDRRHKDMWITDVQRKVQCVLWLEKFESVTRVRHEFHCIFNEEPPHENNIRRWDRQLKDIVSLLGKKYSGSPLTSDETVKRKVKESAYIKTSLPQTAGSGLSSSEWRDALKLTGNVAPVRTIPGRTLDNNHCRRCHSEVETLAHVLGSCPFGETLRNSRHHKIRSVIATCLKSNGYTTYEEVHGIADTGSHRRIDIITFKPGETKGYILDPTIRFETHLNQPEEVNLEKRTIYETSIPYYKTSYKLRDIEVIGCQGSDSYPHHIVKNNLFIADTSDTDYAQQSCVFHSLPTPIKDFRKPNTSLL
ncbi:hypothetical protein ANN_09059 [Periplaneta americana]|uniref:Uncharacterized protein n=1 Tax=Periplaneta americana TaxID=6978 RepID=A0ABQ8TKI0_PERAM|nr:hypothetical protein ANN_09059 [Periplaneta americana]